MATSIFHLEDGYINTNSYINKYFKRLPLVLVFSIVNWNSKRKEKGNTVKLALKIWTHLSSFYIYKLQRKLLSSTMSTLKLISFTYQLLYSLSTCIWFVKQVGLSIRMSFLVKNQRCYTSKEKNPQLKITIT